MFRVARNRFCPGANYIFQVMAEPRAALQAIGPQLQLDQVHKDYTGRGVLVAVIDSGVDSTHRDLDTAVHKQFDFVSESTGQSEKESEKVSEQEREQERGVLEKTDGKDKTVAEIHGTAVAGLIAARVNQFGIRGIAPDVKLLALRACEQLLPGKPEAQCYSASVAKSVDRAIQEKAKLVNLSLGMQHRDPLLSQLIEAGHRESMLFVAPVGNAVRQTDVAFPARHGKVIAVAGSTQQQEPFPNAALASKAFVRAPATQVFSTVPGNKHNFLTGTSLSSAIVSGILALAQEQRRQAHQTLTLQSLRTYGGRLCVWQLELLGLEGSIATCPR